MTISDTADEQFNVAAVALQLFKERSTQSGISPKQLAIECFRDATAFTQVAEDIATGDVDLNSEDDNPLDVAYAPNLKRTHPVNLMSRTWGDLEKVREVINDLDANPAVESYELYEWGKPEVNQARYLFPAVINRAKEFDLAK